MFFAEKKYCTGCAACMQICPKEAIFMKEDKEGFLYPEIDNSICVNCGLCQKVCPVLEDFSAENKPLPETYAVINPDNNERECSSSGGLFILLAKKILADNGIVFGAVFDENWEVYHSSGGELADVMKMMGSKYMQSRIEKTYSEAENFLKIGRKVLFSGTPCQIKGLRSFLRHEYENLLTVDLICHGVPSGGVWRRYLAELCQRQNLGNINSVEFRNKNDGWQRFRLHASGIFAGKDSAINKKYSVFHRNDPYMQGFLSNIYLRPSCYNCKAKAGNSMSDITIADFWGINKILPEFDDDMGVSLLLVNTGRGAKFISDIELYKKQVGFEEAVSENCSWSKSVMPHPKREYFFKKIQKGKSVASCVKHCLKTPLAVRMFNKAKRILMRIIK